MIGRLWRLWRAEGWERQLASVELWGGRLHSLHVDVEHRQDGPGHWGVDAVFHSHFARNGLPTLPVYRRVSFTGDAEVQTLWNWALALSRQRGLRPPYLHERWWPSGEEAQWNERLAAAERALPGRLLELRETQWADDRTPMQGYDLTAYFAGRQGARDRAVAMLARITGDFSAVPQTREWAARVAASRDLPFHRQA